MTDLSLHPQTDQDPSLELCPTCQHPLAAHDRIGLRWCAATQLGVGTTGLRLQRRGGQPDDWRCVLGSDQTRLRRALTRSRIRLRH